MRNQSGFSRDKVLENGRRGRIFLTVIFTIVATLVLAGFLFIGRGTNSHSFSLKGGRPYPLAELLSVKTADRPLPANYRTKELSEIAEIPSRREFTTTLDDEGVVVSYDGTTFSNADIAEGESVCLQSAIEVVNTNALAQGLDPSTAVSELESSSYCLDQAISLDVFKRAAVQAAISSGNGATLSQAQAYAEQQLATQQAFDQTPGSPQLPAGETAESITTCTPCVIGYQQDLDLQYETKAITGTTDTGQTQSTEILEWFSNVMANETSLSITSVPGLLASNLVQYLPWAMETANLN